MSRKGPAPKREVAPDPLYHSKMVTKFINKLMVDGKRGLAQRIFYNAMDQIKEQTNEDPMDVFEAAVKNVMPVLEVKARRVGGATYQVPVEVQPHRKQVLAIRWMVKYARERSERSMSDRLAGELLDAYNNTGGAIKKKEDTHKMAEANKAFAHYRW